MRSRPTPRSAPGVRSRSPGWQVVLGERLRPRDEGVRAVGAVAPAVEGADEPALARARGPRPAARPGDGRRSGTPAPPCRRCGARRPTGRGSGTRRSRAARGSPRGGTPSARPGARAARPPSGRSPGRSSAPCAPGPGTPSRRAPGAPTTSDPRSPRGHLPGVALWNPYTNRSVQYASSDRSAPPLRRWTRSRTPCTGSSPRRLMEPAEAASDLSSERFAADVDVLVVGAGITGIYQLYRAREAGFSVQLLEAGDGVGGTWYWNRYPGARFDSESYTYAYLFSKELFDEWEWQEQFAEQPETERYLNHVVDRFDLRRHMRFGARGHLGRRTTSRPGPWTRDDERRCRGSGRGSSSPPPASSRCRTSPTCPGARTSEASRTTPGCGRTTPVDFAGKRVAVIGTGSSGVQLIPAIADRGRLAHRVPAHRQLVHAAQQRADHRRRAGAAAGRLRDDLRDAEHLAERVPPSRARSRHLRRLERGAAGVLREDVEEPRVLQAHQQLHRPAVRSRRQRGVVRVRRREDPGHRRGPRHRRAS